MNELTLHPFAAYWDKGVSNVPDMTGAKHLLDGRDLVAVCSSLGIELPLMNVLDIGCGTGRLEQFCDGYLGADISPSMVQYCHLRNIPAQLTIMPADLPDGPFEWVTAISVCTHIDKHERTVLLRRVRAIAANALIDIIPGDGSGNVAYWSAVPSQFEADCVEAGFEIVGQADHQWDAALHRYYRLRAA